MPAYVLYDHWGTHADLVPHWLKRMVPASALARNGSQPQDLHAHRGRGAPIVCWVLLGVCDGVMATCRVCGV